MNRFIKHAAISFVGLLCYHSSLHAGNYCKDLFENEFQITANLDPFQEFKLRLDRRDFQASSESSLDPSIVIVRQYLFGRIGHYAARVIGITPHGDLEVVNLIGEKVPIKKLDLFSARMGSYESVLTFENHEKEFDTPYRRVKSRPDRRANVSKPTREKLSVFEEYKNVLDKVAPPFDSQNSRNSDLIYISQGYWREWVNDSTIPDQGWKLHVSAPVKMAGLIASAILPKLREQEILHKVVSDLNSYAELNADDTQRGKFITIYPKNDHEAVLIKDLVSNVLKSHNLADLDFPIPAGELQVASGVFARYGRFTQNSLTVNGRRIERSENMILLPSGKVVRDERGGPIPEGIENPFSKR